jgi:hypothetical protein
VRRQRQPSWRRRSAQVRLLNPLPPTTSSVMVGRGGGGTAAILPHIGKLLPYEIFH